MNYKIVASNSSEYSHVKTYLGVNPLRRPDQSELGTNFEAGDRHHRAFVGPPQNYDLASAMQFNLLTALGMRETHTLLDIGCGSLRGGRLSIMYLLPGHYYGIEPEKWLIEEGISNEIGADFVELKKPSFSNDSEFRLSVFGRTFDYLNAQSIFSHASAQQIRNCLREAKKVMTPSSIFAATFILGDEDYQGDAWVYPGCVTYTEATIHKMVEEQGLACTSTIWPHLYDQTWFVITDPKNLDSLPPLSDATSIAALHQKLKSLQKEFDNLRSHPYVKFGRRIRRILRR